MYAFRDEGEYLNAKNEYLTYNNFSMQREDNMTKLVSIQPTQSLLHHILAVSFAENSDDDIIQTNVAGFICV